MKKYLVLMAVLCFSFEGFAQQIEAYGNVGFSKIDDSDFLRGKSIGVSYHFKKKNLIGFSLNGSYEEKGYNRISSLGNLITSKFDYLSLKGLVRIGNSNVDVQVGTYLSIMTKEEYYYNNVPQRIRFPAGNRDMGFNININQRLFSTGNVEYYLRGEANYGLFSLFSSDVIAFDENDRNINLGLGLAVRWNYKN
ncbi:MAG: hypothetical protein AB8G11_16355 [Saprospiraceae bacterium]